MDHAEEVGRIIFPAGDHSAEVVQPGIEAFDLPAFSVPTQGTTILCQVHEVDGIVRSDQVDAIPLAQVLVEPVGVVRGRHSLVLLAASFTTGILFSAILSLPLSASHSNQISSDLPSLLFRAKDPLGPLFCDALCNLS